MARYQATIIDDFLQIGALGASNQVKGKAFEDLACYLFESIPGVEITARNQLNQFNTEEIDVAIWNDKKRNGLFFLPHIVLIECKNWSKPVSSSEVNWFCSKLENRGRDYGILIANHGITGDQNEINAAHRVISTFLTKGIHTMVITKAEIANLTTTQELIRLLKFKLCQLAVSGAF